MNTTLQSQPLQRPGKRLGGCTGRGWQPGQSGNPSGLKRGSVSLTAALRRTLTREDAERISRKLVDLAIGGDLNAIRILFDRLDDAAIEARITRLEAALASLSQPPAQGDEQNRFQLT